MMARYDRVSAGMSKAFKARSRACPKCGKKTIQPKPKNYWSRTPHVCRWCPKPSLPGDKRSNS